MEALQTEIAGRSVPVASMRTAMGGSSLAVHAGQPAPASPTGHPAAKRQLLEKLGDYAARGQLNKALAALTDYVGASHYLLARYDLSQDSGLDFVMVSDWPFDVVKRLGQVMQGLHAKTNEQEKCLSLLHPVFMRLPEEAVLGRGISREYCAITFSIGRLRLSLMLLFPQDLILSREGLRDIGLLTGYFASLARETSLRSERDFDLTERELECLSWIAEGKTSEEIALILGISRNTINNYITSVMRKTATKTRSEAIACAVRNNLV
ncbi:DNA-binding CsgD family transcriptional regulator [Rhizobium sp. PP-F2F-G36]|nr:DNA-binding CsgD family transcriptional regulator [Rhizobium sp. PP-F2F-G36]